MYSVGFDKYEGVVTIIGPDGFRIAVMNGGTVARSLGEHERIAAEIVAKLNNNPAIAF